MRRKAGKICMFLGVLLVFSALLLFAGNQWEDRRAGERSDQALSRLIKEFREDEQVDPYEEEMAVVRVDGYEYIGILSVPSLSLELPVMAEWDNERLKIAPCRYAGSAATGNLVLCAHNYRRHFSGIKRLVPGDVITFTGMDGRVWKYQVDVVETLPPTAVEEMTAGEYELTLFTCTYGGKAE